MNKTDITPLCRGPGLIRHPGAHHPGRLGHIDRGDPLVNALVLLVLDLLRFLHSQATSSS